MDAAAVARPYAAAVFSLARESGDIKKWRAALSRFADTLGNAREAAAGRLLEQADLKEILMRVADGDLQQKFIALLAENRRLEVVGQIFAQFDDLRLEDAGIIRVRVQSAAPIGDKKEFDRLLEKRFGKKVESEYEEAPALLGGVRVYARDEVLDASMLGRLNKLSAALS